MRTTLAICLFLATHLHAESIALSSSAALISTSTTATLDISLSYADAITSSSLFDVEEELTKIATSCLSSRDYKLLTGNVVRHSVARGFGRTLISEGVVIIGLTELRAVLKLPAPHPWQPYNRTKPSEDELASAPTIEAYYDLKEPRSKMRSLNSEHLFEHNVATAIAYLNKRLPSIRTIFRKTFEEIRRSNPEVLDKKAIDRMIDEFVATLGRIRNATSQMLSFRRDDECWDAVD